MLRKWEVPSEIQFCEAKPHSDTGGRAELVVNCHPIIWMTKRRTCPHISTSAQTGATENWIWRSENGLRSVSSWCHPGLEQLSAPLWCLPLVRLSPGLEGSSCCPLGELPATAPHLDFDMVVTSDQIQDLLQKKNTVRRFYVYNCILTVHVLDQVGGVFLWLH